jgi:hypothetical protein
MGSKGSQQTTQSSSTATQSADPQAAAFYRDVLSRAEAASQTPYQAYQGQRVAGFTPDQLAAMQGVTGLQGTYAPLLQTAGQFATAAGQPISSAQINAAMSPYIQGVIQPTLDIMSQQQQQQMSQLRGTEAQQGAFGGTRSAVAEANLANQQLNAKNQMVASLMQQGYSQAVAQAQADRAAAAQGAGVAANVAGADVQTPLTALGAQLQTGSLQQQLAQQQLNVPYQNYLQAQAYPYQQLSWLTGIGGSLGPLLGGTSTSAGTTTTTPAQPSLLSQIAGGALALGSLAIPGGGSLGGAALMNMFSADGGRVPHKADGGSVGGDIDVINTMARALQMAASESAPAPMADGGRAVPTFMANGGGADGGGMRGYSSGTWGAEYAGSDPNERDENYRLATRKMIPPSGGRQIYYDSDGNETGRGPMNITPYPMRMERARGGQVRGFADGGAPPVPAFVQQPQMQTPGSDLVQGALKLASVMRQGSKALGGGVSHMAGGGVPGETVSAIGVGGTKIPNIFPTEMRGSGRLSVSGPGFVSNPMMKQPNIGETIKGLGSAFKYPTTTGAPPGSPGNSMTSGTGPFAGSAGDPTGGGLVLTSAAYGGRIPKQEGGSLFDPTPIDQQGDLLQATDASQMPIPIDEVQASVPLPPVRPVAANQTIAPTPISEVAAIEPASAAPVSTLGREARALSNIESGGRYDLIGPAANKAGNRAYGKYQVMDFNVGPWTNKYYGKELTPQEFLRNPDAQEAVFQGEFGRLSSKYGSPEAAARAWFAGEGGMNQPGRRDILGTSVADYSRKFLANLGQPVTGGPEPITGEPTTGQALSLAAEPSLASSEGQRAILSAMRPQPQAADTSGLALPFSPEAQAAGTPARAITTAPPTQNQVAQANRATSIFEKLTGMELSPEARMGLMAMGLKMMTTPGSFGTALGAGGMQGMATYTDAQRFQYEQAVKDTQIRRELEIERHNRAVEQETMLYHEQSLRAPKVYTDPESGEQHVMIPRIGANRSLDWFDMNLSTGAQRPISSPAVQSQPGSSAASSSPQAVPPPNKEAFPKEGEGTVQANQRLVSQSYDYRKDAPYIDKGMDVPDPKAVGGRSVDSLKTDAEKYFLTGQLPSVRGGASPVAINQNLYRNAVQNYGNALAASRGLTPAQLAEMHRSAPGMLKFIMGPDGRATVSLGTAIRHLDTLQQLANAWEANDTQAINRIRTTLSREFGSDAATNINTAASIVGPEIIKAIGVAGAGGEKERESAGSQFSSAQSPTQMRGAIQTVQKLMAGQLEGRMRQARASGVSDAMFKNLIGDRPYEILTKVGEEERKRAESPKGNEVKPEQKFTGRTATGPNGKKLRETVDGKWVP